MITLKYTINGAKFKSRYELEKAHHAFLRAQQLRSNGIPVKIIGMPRRVSISTALKMAEVK